MKPDPDSHDTSWLRQGQVASARAATYPNETMLELAAPRLLALERSLTAPNAVLALTQFDLISCLLIRETGPNGFYPNAAKFSESLAEPIVFEQLREPDNAIRQYVYSGDQEGLREGLRDYDDKARLYAAQARRVNLDWQWRGAVGLRKVCEQRSFRRRAWLACCVASLPRSRAARRWG